LKSPGVVVLPIEQVSGPTVIEVALSAEIASVAYV